MKTRQAESFFAVSTAGRFQGDKLANLYLSEANRWGSVERAKRFHSKADAEAARDKKARTSSLELTVVQVTLG